MVSRWEPGAMWHNLMASSGVWRTPHLHPLSWSSQTDSHLLPANPAPPDQASRSQWRCVTIPSVTCSWLQDQGHLHTVPGPGSWLMLRDCISWAQGGVGKDLPQMQCGPLLPSPVPCQGQSACFGIYLLCTSGIASAALGPMLGLIPFGSM